MVFDWPNLYEMKELEFVGKRPEDWTTADVGGWLRSVGMEWYQPLFEKQGVTGNVLLGLEERDLVSLGVRRLSHLQYFMKVLESLNSCTFFYDQAFTEPTWEYEDDDIDSEWAGEDLKEEQRTQLEEEEKEKEKETKEKEKEKARAITSEITLSSTEKMETMKEPARATQSESKVRRTKSKGAGEDERKKRREEKKEKEKEKGKQEDRKGKREEKGKKEEGKGKRKEKKGTSPLVSVKSEIRMAVRKPFIVLSGGGSEKMYKSH